MICLSVIYEFADRVCPQNLRCEATSTIGADFEFGLDSNGAAVSGANAATSFGVVDDLSAGHI